MARKIEISSLTILSWAVVTILVLCNVLLIKQNLQLRTTVKDLIAEQKIQIGEEFRPFNAVDVENKPLEVNFNKNVTKRIILFSSTSCPFCKKQNPYWKELIKQIKHQDYEVLELFNEREEKNKVVDYLKTNGFENENSSFKVLFLADEFLQKNKLNSTPITFLVGENGIVEKVWFGLWDKFIISDVNSSLGIDIKSNN